MPFIKIHTSCPISSEQELQIKTIIGKAIELVPGKTEKYLLLKFESDCHLWLRGKCDEPIAYIEAAIFGNEGHFGYEAFTKEVTRVLADVLQIPPDNIYIRYDDISSWTVRGIYIDRKQYR